MLTDFELYPRWVPLLFLKQGHFELGNNLFTASAINEPTLGFSDFSYAVSAFSQVFIVTRVSH